MKGDTLILADELEQAIAEDKNFSKLDPNTRELIHKVCIKLRSDYRIRTVAVEFIRDILAPSKVKLPGSLIDALEN